MRDDRRRQKRPKRKRRRRKAKRRDPRGQHFTPEVVRAMTGRPKLSDTLLTFAQPLLQLLPDDADAEEWEKVLLLASLVWNGSTADDIEAGGAQQGETVWKESKLRGFRGMARAALGWLLTRRGRRVDLRCYPELMRDLCRLSGAPRSEARGLVAALAGRKEALFADDDRLVVYVRARAEGNDVHVYAASLMKSHNRPR